MGQIIAMRDVDRVGHVNISLTENEIEPEVELRALKNRLQARFPEVRSAHLSEAIAAALRFNTHAALLADPEQLKRAFNFRMFSTTRFMDRLLELNYPFQPDFTCGLASASPTPSARYLAWLAELRQLEKKPDAVWPRVYELRGWCAAEFSSVFDIGHIKSEDKEVVKRWDIGIDHGFCLPRWGGLFDGRFSSLIDFPGSDHRRMFFESLPLLSTTKPKRAEYCSAMVSMPYADKSRLQEDLVTAGHLAGRIGWSCRSLNEWSWYQNGATALVLFKRSTPAAVTRRQWNSSFKRWVFENQSRLKQSTQTRKLVVEDIVDCKHMPLDLKYFSDCRDRYLKEFAPKLYSGDYRAEALVFERLMDKWAAETQDVEAQVPSTH